MAFNYPKTAATATALLAKFGQAVSVARGSGAYDPNTGTITGSVTQTAVGVGVALDYKQGEIDGTLVMAGDRRILIAPRLSITPTTGDTVTLAGGSILRVMASKPLSPAGVVVLHEVQCRGI